MLVACGTIAWLEETEREAPEESLFDGRPLIAHDPIFQQQLVEDVLRETQPSEPTSELPSEELAALRLE